MVFVEKESSNRRHRVWSKDQVALTELAATVGLASQVKFDTDTDTWGFSAFPSKLDEVIKAGAAMVDSAQQQPTFAALEPPVQINGSDRPAPVAVAEPLPAPTPAPTQSPVRDRARERELEVETMELAAQLAESEREAAELKTQARDHVRRLQQRVDELEGDAIQRGTLQHDTQVAMAAAKESFDEQLDLALKSLARSEQELAALQATATDRSTRSDRRLKRVMSTVTAIVILAVAILVSSGSASSAHDLAGWPWWQAVLVPVAIEGVAIVMLAAMVLARRAGKPMHWSGKLTEFWTMTLSLIGLGLHARTMSTHWWSLMLGLSLPLVMIGAFRSTLGSSKESTES
jgi:hypothetical protein